MLVEEIELEKIWNSKVGSEICEVQEILWIDNHGQVIVLKPLQDMEHYHGTEEGSIPMHLDMFLKSFEPELVTDKNF